MSGPRPTLIALLLGLAVTGNAHAEIQWIPQGPQDAYIIS